MGKIRKAPLLALAAIVATALAAPAMASAAEWGTEGKPITKPTPIALSGEVVFNYPGVGTLACGSNGEAILYPGSSGEFTDFEFHNMTCKGADLFASCQVTAAVAYTPWSMQAQSDKIFVPEMKFDWTFAQCLAAGTWEFNAAVSATPNKTSAISSLSLSGPVTVVTPLGVMKSSLSGTLKVSPAGHYGIY